MVLQHAPQVVFLAKKVYLNQEAVVLAVCSTREYATKVCIRNFKACRLHKRPEDQQKPGTDVALVVTPEAAVEALRALNANLRDYYEVEEAQVMVEPEPTVL